MSPCPCFPSFCKTEHGGYGSCTTRQKNELLFSPSDRKTYQKSLKNCKLNLLNGKSICYLTLITMCICCVKGRPYI